MTYQELCERLRNAGIEAPEWEASCLLETLCGADRLSVLANPMRTYPEPALAAAVERRLAHEPLQYILGYWQFWRQTYRVTPDCLIPRADTEILVEEAVKRLPSGARFADLCTGSGCIGISVLSERPDTQALGVELSEKALLLAAENARTNRVEDRFSLMQADILSIEPQKLGTLDAILSNPPYIRTDVVDTLSVEVQCEPRMALDGGADGLCFYRELLRLATACLKRDGFCLFEIGYDQGEQICALAAEHGFSCTLRKDYGGQDRVAVLTFSRGAHRIVAGS